LAGREAQESRDRLIDAALREFAVAGYAGARTDRIARDAGVNKQLIFYYFGSKVGLYRTILERARVQLTTTRPPPSSLTSHASERLRRRFRWIVEALFADGFLSRTLVRAALESGDESDLARETLRELARDVAREISRGQGLGYFRDDVEPLRSAEHALLLVLGAFTFGEVFTAEMPHGDRTAWADQVSDELIRSLTW
jgi:TetR/AcrR family transcriptional regulator